MQGTLGVRRLVRLVSLLSASSLAAALAVAEASPVQAAGVAYTTGDVFAGVGTGLIKHFDSSGTLKDTLNTGTGCSEDLGMAFDSANNLYATASFGSCFGSGKVVKFDNMGNLVGAFGGPYSASTESIAINAAGHVFVGQPDGTRTVVENDSAGAHVADHTVATQNRGSDWIDLAADQCTLYYTSEGSLVKRFNVCTDTQLTDFATLPNAAGSVGYAVRIRPNGEVLVAGVDEVVRFDSTGVVLKEYPKPVTETSFLFAMNLDPDGTSFWTAGYFTANVYRYDIATGALLKSFNAGALGCCLSGLAVAGEIRVAIDKVPPTCVLTSSTAGPPAQIVVTVQDADDGLNTITHTETNATVVVDSFTPGTKNPVNITATKIDQTTGASLNVVATDMSGNQTVCDPTLITDGTGKPTRATIDGSEGKVTIANGGLRSITIEVNGQTFALRDIADQTNLSLNISSALNAGSNAVTVHGQGNKGTSAALVFSS